MEFISWALLGSSLVGNGVLAFVLLRPRKKKQKYDLTAQDLLHDLTRRGQAILRVEVIDAANLMLRSPRG